MRFFVVIDLTGSAILSKHATLVIRIGTSQQENIVERTETLRDFQSYCQVRKVADFIVKELEATGFKCADRRDTNVNPYDHRTASGIFLQLLYGTAPRMLWTMWGEYEFLASVTREEKGAPIVTWTKICAFFQPVHLEGSGLATPVFALHAFGHHAFLPEPVLLEDRQPVSSTEVAAAWRELTVQYRELPCLHPR